MLMTGEYQREHALAYARRWALSRNPLFYNFTEVGGDSDHRQSPWQSLRPEDLYRW